MIALPADLWLIGLLAALVPAGTAGPARPAAYPTRSCSAACARATAPISPDGTAHPAAWPSGASFRELQMNLCNSGFAGCYRDGLSVTEAQDRIADTGPDLVTLNEVCTGDVLDTLHATMARLYPNDWVFSAFMPAMDRRVGGPYQCADGRGDYGIGIVGHVPADRWAGVASDGDVYPDQDTTSNEERVWLCADVVGGYYGCTTHLVNTDPSIAMRQCRYLMDDAVPAVWQANGGYRPTIVGGDLNLRYGGSPDVQDCVPAGWYRKGDGDVQHVLATDDLAFEGSAKIPMIFTDHPAWLVDVAFP